MKARLLGMLQNENHAVAINDVLRSGWMPEDLHSLWVETFVERSIRRALGCSDCPEWEDWALKWLSNEDRSELSARAVRECHGTALAASEVAARAARGLSGWAIEGAILVAERAGGVPRAEFDQIYKDLVRLINGMGE